jgi:hypothetical protein
MIDSYMTRTLTREADSAISEIIRSAPAGSVLVLAALDYEQPFEGFSALKPDLGDSITILSIDDGLDYLLEKNGCRFVSLRRILPAGVYTGIHLLAEEMAGRWNLLNGQDITEFEGVSYASLVQWEMTYLFARIMKSVVDAQAVLAAGLGHTFLIPVRSGLDPMIRFSPRDIMGDAPESLFSDALSYLGKDLLRVERIMLPTTPRGEESCSRWRVRTSQAIQGWIVSAVLPRLRRPLVYVQDEYYLGPELIKALSVNRRYRLLRETSQGLKQCLRALSGRGVFHVPPGLFGQPVAERARRRAALHFGGSSWARAVSVQSNGSLQFRDVDMGPLVEKKLHFLFEKKFPELAGQQAQVCKWVETLKISAAILVEQVKQWPRQLVAAGRPVGMRSLCIQHGVMGYRDIGTHIGFVPVVADVTAVWGKLSSTWLREAGVPADQIAVVGPPRFDRYPKQGRTSVSAQEREAFCRLAGIRPSDRLILFAETTAHPFLFPDTHLTFHDARRHLELLLTAFRQLPEFKLGIRCRFGADDPYAVLYRDLIDRHAVGNALFLPDLPLMELLLHSELTVVSFSGVAIEALYYDHPVIVVDLTGYHRVIPIVEYGAGILANSPEEFVEFVHSYDVDADLRDQLQRGREQLLKDYVGRHDGCASHRVLTLLDYLIDKGPAATRAAIVDGHWADGQETAEHGATAYHRPAWSAD